MEKAFCAVLVLVGLGSLSESRSVTDRRFNKFGKFDLDSLWGNDFDAKKTVIDADGEEYLFGSCEILPASAWSMASGIIEFRQKVTHLMLITIATDKAGSGLEMSVNITGLSNTVPFYKLQVYTSGEILDGCSYGGEPFITESYSGHLADITATNGNGEVHLDVRNVAATLFGDDCIFGRSIQMAMPSFECENPYVSTTFGTVHKWSLRPLLNSPKGGDRPEDNVFRKHKERITATYYITDYEGKEPEACCIIVHDSIEDLEQVEEPVEVAMGDEETSVYKETDRPDGLPESVNVNTDSGVKNGQNEPNENIPMLTEDEENLSEQDEAGWSDFVDSVFKEAEKDGIDPDTITDITDLSNSLDDQRQDNILDQMGLDEKDISFTTLGDGNGDANPSNLLDVVFKAAKEKGIPLKAISKVVDLSNNINNFDLKDLENSGDILFERKKLDLSNIQSLDFLSKGQEAEYLNNQAGSAEDTDWTSIMNDVLQDAKKNGIPEESILKIELDELDNMEDDMNGDSRDWSDLTNEVIKEANMNNISEESITKIDVLPGSNGMPLSVESNDEDLMENTDWSDLMEQVLEDAKKNNISEDSILKILEISGSDNVEEIIDGDGSTQSEEWSNFVEEVMKEARKQNISEESISKIVELAEGEDPWSGTGSLLGEDSSDIMPGQQEITDVNQGMGLQMFPDGTLSNSGDPGNEEDLSNLVDEAIKEANNAGIPTDAITRIDIGPADGETNELNEAPNDGYDNTELNDGVQDSQGSDLVNQVIKEAAKEGIPPESITEIVELGNVNNGV